MPQPRRHSPRRKERRSRSRSPDTHYQLKRRKHLSAPGRSRSRSFSPRPISPRRRSRSPVHARKSKTHKQPEIQRHKPSLERRESRRLSGKRDPSPPPFVAPPALRRSPSPPPKSSHRSRSPGREFEHVERHHSSHRYSSPPESREFRGDAGFYKSPEQMPVPTHHAHDERRRFSGEPVEHGRMAYDPPMEPVRQPALSPQFRPESIKPVEQYADLEPRVIASGNTRDVYTGISSIKIPKSAMRLKSLNSRFILQDQEYQGPFKISENITIGIHRHPNIRSTSPVQISRDIDTNDFVMLHKKDGGKRPIFDREEIKQFRHDENLDDETEFVERRVISVVPSETKSRHSEFKLPAQDVDYRTGPPPSGSQWSEPRHSSSDRRESSRKLTEHDRREVETSRSYSKPRRDSSRENYRQPEVRLDPRPDPRYEELYKQTKEREQRSSYRERVKIEKVQHNPGDLRHNLLRRKQDDEQHDPNFDARKRIEAKRRVSDPFKETKVHKEHRSRDRERGRERDHGRIDGREGERERHDSSSNRDSFSFRESSNFQGSSYRGRSNFRGRSEERPTRGSTSRPGDFRPSFGDKDSVPDFKNRSDKYQYEEWKEKPELIPRGPSYFEHDDREDDDFDRPLGRGRGYRGTSTYRPRGFRGINTTSYRGRGRGFSSRGFSSRRPFNSRFGSRFRGRGRGFTGLASTGSYGRDGRDRESGGGDWKHDMFDKIEKEEDNKPSSTTKN